MPYTMSFVIIKWAVVGLFLFGILGLVFIPILSVKLGMNVSEMFGIFKDCIYVYAAFLMAFVGYFVGRGQRAE